MPSVFDAVDAYEVAFSYRDVGAEVDQLSAWCSRHSSGAPRAVLELAAGPAAHAVEFARRGTAATASGLTSAMGARAAGAGSYTDASPAGRGENHHPKVGGDEFPPPRAGPAAKTTQTPDPAVDRVARSGAPPKAPPRAAPPPRPPPFPPPI